MIKISKKDFDKIVAHAKSKLPNEACGLIACEITGGNKIIRKVYPLTNTDVYFRAVRAADSLQKR